MKINKSDVFKVVFLSIIIIWIICFFIDYFRARQEKMPLFCVHKETKVYEDGKVDICDGIGYKMIKYDRSSIPVSIDFGPFFIKERTK